MIPDKAKLQARLTRLTRTVAADQGGGVAQRGFQYQISFAIITIVGMHDDGQEYAVLLDYHEDVVVIRPGGNSFFQVKSTKKPSISWSDLVKKSGSGHSFISRLFYNAIVFSDDLVECTLISNAPFSVFLKDAPRTERVSNEFGMDSVEDKRRSKLFEHLHEAHAIAIQAIGWDGSNSSKVGCKKCELDLDHHESASMGRVMQWLETLGCTSSRDTRGFYQTIRATLQRRAALVINEREGADKKTISKKEISLWIEQTMQNRFSTARDRCSRIIDHEFPTIFRQTAKRTLDLYLTSERTNPTQEALFALREWISSTQIPDGPNHYMSIQAMDALLPSQIREKITDDKRRQIIMLFEVLYEAEDPHSKTDPQPAEGQA